MAFLTISIASLSGCVTVEKGVNVDKDAIHVLDGGVHPKVEVQKDAFPTGVLRVEKGAITVEPGAVSQPLVAQGAVSFKIEQGAIQFHPGAIQLNVGQKGPPLDVAEISKALQQLKPLGGIDALPDEQQKQIIMNEAVMQEVIKSLLRLIEEYNKNYTTGMPKEVEHK